MEPVTQLQRPARGAPLAGVCAAVADHTRVDPLLIRAIAVVLALSSGIGLVAYAVGWGLIPRAGEERSLLARYAPSLANAPTWVFVALALAAVVVVVSVVGTNTPMGLAPAIIIGAVWYFGVHRPRQEERTAHRATSPPPAQPGPAGPPPAAAPRAPGAGPLFPADPGVGTPQGPHFLDPYAPAAPDAAPPPGHPAPQSSPAPQHSPAPHLPPGPHHAPAPQHSPAPVPHHVSAPVPHHVSAPQGSRPVGSTAYGGPGVPEMSAFLSHPDPVGLYTASPPSRHRRWAPDPQARGKRVLGFGTLLAVGLVWLALVGIGQVRGAPLSAAAYPLAALLVTAVALIIGAWVGRPRLMLAAMMVSALTLTGVVALDSPRAGNFDTTVLMSPVVAPPEALHITSPDRLSDEPMHWDVGDAVIDLSDMSAGADGTQVQASLGLGSLTIYVPDNYEVIVTGNVEAGSLTVSDTHGDLITPAPQDMTDPQAVPTGQHDMFAADQPEAADPDAQDFDAQDPAVTLHHRLPAQGESLGVIHVDAHVEMGSLTIVQQ